jgi:hypothetical protein
MLKDNHNSLSNVPNPSIKRGTIKEKLIEFIESTLLKFQNQFKGEVNTSEEVLNEHLDKTLNYYSKSQPFFFQSETRQKQLKGNDRKVDIGVFKHYADNYPFFTIEAKRLSNLIPKNREKEYVIGSDSTKLSGGIERFKHNVHGVNLNHSAIIGYVQNEDVKYWYTNINIWIQELIDGKILSSLKWISNDSLKNTCGLTDLRLAKFISESEKIDKSKINLNHYFVNLCP